MAGRAWNSAVAAINVVARNKGKACCAIVLAMTVAAVYVSNQVTDADVREAIASDDVDGFERCFARHAELLCRGTYECGRFFGFSLPTPVKSLLKKLRRRHDENNRTFYQTDEHGMTPLMYAAAYGAVHVTAFILELSGTHSRELLLQNNGQRKTAFLWATSHGNEAVARRILRAALDLEPDSRDHIINGRDEHGMTPLMYASSRGLSGVVDDLLKFANARLSIRSPEGLTPLALASKGGHRRTVRTILRGIPPVMLHEQDVDLALWYTSDERIRALLNAVHGPLRGDSDGDTGKGKEPACRAPVVSAKLPRESHGCSSGSWRPLKNKGKERAYDYEEEGALMRRPRSRGVRIADIVDEVGTVSSTIIS